MSDAEVLARSILNTFVTKMDNFEASIQKLSSAIDVMSQTNRDVLIEIKELRLEMRELMTTIKMAIQKK
jgi:regulator of replication initiation timing